MTRDTLGPFKAADYLYSFTWMRHHGIHSRVTATHARISASAELRDAEKWRGETIER